MGYWDVECEHNLSILCISESQLLSTSPNSYIGIPGYNMFRNDTETETDNHSVCCYVILSPP